MTMTNLPAHPLISLCALVLALLPATGDNPAPDPLAGGVPTVMAAPASADTLPRHEPRIDARARRVQFDSSAFGPDPEWPEEYDYQAQLDIYGGKYLNPTQRPLLELGRDLYQIGPLSRSHSLLGAHNLVEPQLMVYGDFRTSSAFNDAGGEGIGTVAGRLNLDVDFRITGTERIHALFRPFDSDGEFTRFDLTGDSTGFKDHFDATPDALFFEGDLGAILGGFSGRDAPFDLPFAAGLMPLLFHNGVWVEDVFTGFAFTLPARNSRGLDWSNFDITFFAGLDRVSNPGFSTGPRSGRLYGVNTFIEAYRGFAEVGYAFVQGEDELGEDFHSVALSFTRRYRDRIANSFRYLGAFGQSPEQGEPLAGGHLLLLENSLITRSHYTFVPYFNFFLSIDRPAPAARDPGSGSLLKNTALSFESDGLTGFPTLTGVADDVAGGAIGINRLAPDFSSQIVAEVALTYPWRDTSSLPAQQIAFGLRYQRPLTNAIILRLDGMYGMRTDLDNVMGVRLELRHKF